MYTGPKLTNSNLVFGYDTGYGVADNATATRFYAGEPAVNLYGDISNGNARPNRTEYNTSAWTANFKKPPEDVGRVYSHASGSLNSTWSGNSYGYTLISYSYLANTTYTLSCWVYVSSDANITGMSCSMEGTTLTHTANRSYDLNNKGTWQQIKLSCNSSSAVNGNAIIAYPSRSGVTDGSHTGFWAIGGAKLEINDSVTPYVLGTRSSTASLIDLTKTTDIDVSNVSFDSTGQPEFDGTNDVITTSFPATTIPTVTIEAVVYRNQATGRYEAIVQNNNATDDALYVNPSGVLMFWPCGGSSLTVPTGQWSHVAVSYNGTTLTYIVNGTTQVVTATCSHITDWDFLRIGGHGTTDSERWIGKIAVAKVYEKSLSAAELISNYNAYKNRFNI